MFYSISRVKNVLIYLHDCSGRTDELVSELKQAMDPYNHAWLAKRMGGEWWRQFDIEDSDVVRAESFFENSFFQNVIRRALQEKNMKRSETVIVSSHPKILDAATDLLLGTICLTIDPSIDDSMFDQYGIDFGVDNVKTLGEALNGKFAGFASEVFAAPDSCKVTPTNSGKQLLGLGWIENKNTGNRYYHGGRYFSEKKDSRHDLHPLSLRIIDSKNNNRQAAMIEKAFAFLIRAVTSGEFDLVSHVPPKTEGETDRFAGFLKNLHRSNELGEIKIGKEQVRDDLLKCIRPYESLKTFGAADRAELVKDAYEANKSAVAGKRIVLLDDVVTSGSTLNECIRQLTKAGAKEVIPIVLAYKPFKNKIIQGLGDTPPYTNCCDWPQVVRFNRDHGEPFFGCSAWHYGDEVNHKYSKFVETRAKILIESEPSLLGIDPEEADVEY